MTRKLFSFDQIRKSFYTKMFSNLCFFEKCYPHTIDFHEKASKQIFQIEVFQIIYVTAVLSNVDGFRNLFCH